MATKKEETKKEEKTEKTDDKTDTATPPVESPEKTYTQAQLDAERKRWERESEKKIKDAEEKAKLSEDERLKADLLDAQKQLRERDARDSAVAAAEKAGIKNPRLFYNAYRGDLEIGEDGRIKNLNETIETAKLESPELFGSTVTQPQTKTEGGADGGEGKNTPPSTLSKESIEKMSPKEISENMDAIDAFLATQ